MISLKELRRWSAHLKHMPFHPQWLIFSDTRASRKAITRLLRNRVLDVGCGDRWIEENIRSGTEYIGLDYPLTVSKGYPGRVDVFADGQRLPFKADSIDTVLLLDVLEHIVSPGSVLAEAYRVLKPGGLVVLQVPFLYPLHDEPHDYHRWTDYGLRLLLERQGFKINELIHYGNPVRTASALAAISLAKSILDAVSQRHPALILAPFMIVAMPFINIIGWLISILTPNSTFMPLGYRAVAVKPV